MERHIRMQPSSRLFIEGSIFRHEGIWSVGIGSASYVQKLIFVNFLTKISDFWLVHQKYPTGGCFFLAKLSHTYFSDKNREKILVQAPRGLFEPDDIWGLKKIPKIWKGPSWMSVHRV